MKVLKRKASTKVRISVTILPLMNIKIDLLRKRTGMNRSAIVEKALQELFDKQLEADAKVLATLKADDIPTEDEWLMIQPSLEPYDEA